MFNRRVVLHADRTIVEAVKRIALREAEALKVAAHAGIPAPRVRDVYLTSRRSGLYTHGIHQRTAARYSVARHVS